MTISACLLRPIVLARCLRRTFDSVDNAPKLREEPITHEFENPPMMPRNLWLKQLCASRSKALKVAASSCSMSAEYPTTSAARIADNLRSMS